MTGTPEQGRKAAQTLKARDPDYYIKLGRKSNEEPNRNRYSYFRELKKTNPDKLHKIAIQGGKERQKHGHTNTK